MSHKSQIVNTRLTPVMQASSPETVNCWLRENTNNEQTVFEMLVVFRQYLKHLMLVPLLLLILALADDLARLAVANLARRCKVRRIACRCLLDSIEVFLFTILKPGVPPSPCFSKILTRTTFVLVSLPEAKNPGQDAIFEDFVFESSNSWHNSLFNYRLWILVKTNQCVRYEIFK